MVISCDIKSVFTSISQWVSKDAFNHILTEDHGLKLHGLTGEGIVQHADKIFKQSKRTTMVTKILLNQ